MTLLLNAVLILLASRVQEIDQETRLALSSLETMPSRRRDYMAMTKCKECGGPLSTKADACPACGAKQPRTSGCALVAAWGIGIVVLLVLIGQYNSRPSTPTTALPASAPSSHEQAASTQASNALPELHPAPDAVGANWSYAQTKDQMSPGTVSSAMTESTNTVSFGFPYQGAQHATLYLRSHPRHGQDVIFGIEKGQFLCSSYDGCSVLVRFDDQKAVRYAATGSADNGTTMLFFHNYAGFVAAMSKAKQVRISAAIYQEGAPVFEFDVTGFDKQKYRPSAK
jgi:hypothetical protein